MRDFYSYLDGQNLNVHFLTAQVCLSQTPDQHGNGELNDKSRRPAQLNTHTQSVTSERPLPNECSHEPFILQ